MSFSPDLALLRQPNYTPPRRTLDALCERFIASADPSEKEAIALSLQRVAGDAFRCGFARLSTARGPARPELFALLGRLALTANPVPIDALLELAADPDPRAARKAVIALGKLPQEFAPRIEPVLIERFVRAETLADKRTIGEALGKLGGAQALSVLKDALSKPPQPAPLPKVYIESLERALLRIERSLGRPTNVAISADRPLPGTYALLLRCRAGLTDILVEELGARGLLDAAAKPPQIFEPANPNSGQSGCVTLFGSRPLRELFAARTFSSLAFALPCSASSDDEEELCHAVAEALSLPSTRRLLATLCPDEEHIRYRLKFLGGGHRRALVWRIADAVRRRAPELLNDPKDSPFQIEIRDRGPGPLALTLVPQKLVDPRFVYRRRDVPAASHPPLSAALARLAEAGPDDVIWDPFVGSGSELIELAQGYGCRQLFGTDRDEAALNIARENLAAAGLADGAIRLVHTDALAFVPPVRPTRIVTNPPMGRRTRTGDDPLSGFLAAFLKHAASSLATGGRLIWISPQPRLTASHATQNGLVLRSSRIIDLNGFSGSLEVWQKR